MLTGEKIKLRAVEPEDVDILFKWENNFELWKVSMTLKPFSKNIIKKYIETEHLDIFQTKQLRLMIDTTEDNTKTVGMIDLFDFDPYNNRAGVGIMVHKDYRKNGYALEALQILNNYSFKYLSFHQLYCNISIENKASLELFKKAGYEITAIRKDWIFNGQTYEDVYFLQKINPYHK
jgi:diamine N-acetyltransferase